MISIVNQQREKTGDARRVEPSRNQCVRVLVVIASYGMRNFERLCELIANYRRMEFATDIVVLSEAPKQLGVGVEVVVGLPIANPWSLPFGHRQIFADRADQYDLFVYSEDDMEVTENNLRAFLRVSPDLAADEVAGYLRYESNVDGSRSLPEAHGVAHWKLDTIQRRGPGLVAEFSNEHAAFYVLNREQLKVAIASGGFLVSPHEGKYDMLCSAATDPYTSCGLRKVICLDQVEDFLIHHMTNQYAGRLGASWEEFREEMAGLAKLADAGARGCQLCNLEASSGLWSKHYDEACEDVMRSIPPGRTSILSIGAGAGREEEFWQRQGAAVTALPLTPAKGAILEKRGCETVAGTLEEAQAILGERRFDYVIVSGLLHLQSDPRKFLKMCAAWILPGGQLILKGPNFDFLPVLLKRWMGSPQCGARPDFSQHGFHPVSLSQARRWMAQEGLDTADVTWLSEHDHGNASGALGIRQRLRNWIGRHLLRRCPSRYTADHWLIRARRVAEETIHAGRSMQTSGISVS